MPDTSEHTLSTLLHQAGDVFTINRWLPEDGLRGLRSDMQAGLTVGVMLVPQGMAYAVLAGLPPIYGLYASLLPLLIYPFFGTSRHLAVGVIAIDMLIVAAGLGALAEAGTAEYIELAILLAAMVGLIQILMGIGQLGFIVNLLSRPVIAGFTSAASIIIIFSQLGNFLGVALPQSQHVYTLIWEAVQHIDSVHGLTVIVGTLALALLFVFKRWKPLFPAPLFVVALSILAAWGLGLDAEGMAVVGSIPTGLPRPDLPAISLGNARELMPTALTLALVQFMSVISLGKVFAAQHRYSIDPNRELVAIGASNVVGSLFRSLPVSGSFSRTAVNAQSGARSPLANIFAALLIGLTLLFLTPLFAYLPIPVLAAIIIAASISLLDVKEMRYLLRTKRVDGGIALLTFTVTLVVGIQEGVLTGIAASVVAVMYRISRPNVAVLGHLPGTRSFRDVRRHESAGRIEGILMLRVDASFSFANSEFLKDLILQKSQAADHSIRAVIIDASSINDLDTTAAGVLTAVSENLKKRGVELYFGGMKEPVMKTMRRTDLYDVLGEDHFYLSPHRAVKHLLEDWGSSEEYLEDVPGEPDLSKSEDGAEERAETTS
ncbi:MAG: sulfate permease [Bacteroidetes bacterium]|jgi:SulP family sulfate permease|nr:sulfate permease [Bacteroidota bacterium]